jgi:GNAT superfamily N-acetyltransferase
VASGHDGGVVGPALIYSTLRDLPCTESGSLSTIVTSRGSKILTGMFGFHLTSDRHVVKEWDDVHGWLGGVSRGVIDFLRKFVDQNRIPDPAEDDLDESVDQLLEGPITISFADDDRAIDQIFQAAGLRVMNDKQPGLGAFRDGEMIGATVYNVVYADIFDDPDEINGSQGLAYDFDIAVLPQHQGGTVGFMLVKASIQEAYNNECSQINLMVIMGYRASAPTWCSS